MKLGICVFELARQRHRNPVIEIDEGRSALAGTNAALGHAAKHGGLRQLVDAFIQSARGPEPALDRTGLRQNAGLIEVFGEENEPAADAHDEQQTQHRLGDKTAAFGDVCKTVRICRRGLRGRLRCRRVYHRQARRREPPALQPAHLARPVRTWWARLAQDLFAPAPERRSLRK